MDYQDSHEPEDFWSEVNKFKPFNKVEIEGLIIEEQSERSSKLGKSSAKLMSKGLKKRHVEPSDEFLPGQLSSILNRMRGKEKKDKKITGRLQ